MEKFKIELEHIKKSFSRDVLNDINLKITNESYITILGKSGSGKSTLMNIIGLVENFDYGIYRFNNIDIKLKKDYYKLRLNYIGFIFQSYNLIPTLTCKENIMLPLLYTNKRKKIDNLVELLNIEHLLNSKVNILSGGERQRVAIARALVLEPSLIIADEPTGNLDVVNKNIIFDVLKKENEKGKAILMITHDQETAMQAKNVYYLNEGELVEKK